MENEIDYDIIYQQSYEEARKILAANDYEKLCSVNDHEGIEILFWKLLRDYTEGRIPEITMSAICSDYISEPNHHNMTSEAKNAVYEGADLDYYTYIEANEAKILEIRKNLKQDVSNYFGMWFKNLEK